ncbi:helix-turn-helix transcriptional regulator [Puniceicoccus vermicola]|uniref:Helix-turn-helix transcriptional regulator n=1 Tax=Puniceicoccus vermicola TaxID=388746 RepID=A0A7X1AXP9_9BACT|nr:AraC family transcriptional regulator [Puniceicoccus vermicola]MBC2601829.1 helix-turn-helix transcriptional regulator [Puniceicoccus vermicola]
MPKPSARKSSALRTEPAGESPVDVSASEPDSILQPICELMGKIPPPESLFTGLKVEESEAPNNIIFFERTDVSAFRPEGVSNNFHHRFELVLALQGSGPVRIGGNSYHFSPGSSALIFPNQFHHYMDVEAQNLDWLFITFDIAHSDFLAPLQDTPRHLDIESAHLLQRALKPYTRPGSQRKDTLAISYHLSRFLRHMVSLPGIPPEQSHSQTPDHSRDVILEQINDYIRNHLSDAPSLSDLAQELGYSASYLRTIFRDSLGVSLGRYIRESRLSEAAKLLQKTTLSVGEVSARTGFESPFAFSRAFKNAYGMPPKAYSQKVGDPAERH